MLAKLKVEQAPPPPRTALDIMTPNVVSVPVGTAVGEVAKVLVEHGISAVPVVDGSGELVGIVSEGDLLGRNEEDRVAGRDWWLAMLADPAQPVTIEAGQRSRRVEDVMHAPVITADPETPIRRVADLLQGHKMKRVVVVRDQRPIGIVSRADLLGVAAAASGTVAPTRPDPLGNILTSFFGKARSHGHEGERIPTRPVPVPAAPAANVPEAVTAKAFREVVEASKSEAAKHRELAAQEAELARQRQVKEMLQEHLDTEMWASLLEHAKEAAGRGENEFLLLRFPCNLCSDGGRRVGVHEEGWEKTLRGEAADLYDRWERDLKDKGFKLAARIIDYPGGMPGNIGLFLSWT